MQLRLEAHWILERTEAGHLEIAQRTRKLPLQVRAVLIMVDGKSELHQLLKKMAGMENGVGMLTSLLEDGLLRRRLHTADVDVTNAQTFLRASHSLVQQTLDAKAVPAAPVAPTPIRAHAQAPAPAPAPAPIIEPVRPPSPPMNTGKRRSLALSRMYLLDQIERMLGPQSDAVRNLLRNATTRTALLEAFAGCREILVETSGEERAQRVEQEFMGMLPEGEPIISVS